MSHPEENRNQNLESDQAILDFPEITDQEFDPLLKNAILSPNVTLIGDSAFSKYCFLSTINISSSVKSIGTKVFTGCLQLTAITVEKNNEFYTSIDGILFSKELKKKICLPSTQP